MTTCEFCGGSMTDRVLARAKFCSPSCKDSARNAARTAALRASRGERSCAYCGLPMPDTKFGKAVCCSPVCSWKWQNKKRAAADKAKRLAKLKPCLICGGVIPPSRTARAVYCSDDCLRQAQDQKRKAWSPAYMRQYLYGVTPAQYEAMLVAQDHRCAICRTADWGGKHGVPNVDHCHDTEQVRELLCDACNQGLGRFRHNPDRLDAAAAYLRKWAVYLEKPLEG